jgi:ubiquinone/menaquinone biosynthesis C-methylase UbiE
MTDEMLDLVGANHAKGRHREHPLGQAAISRPSRFPDDSVDVVISNCVINLSTDKQRVIREVARVLKPGGRLAVLRRDRRLRHRPGHAAQHAASTGCIAGALTRVEFATALHDAGLDDVQITEAHRVHENAGLGDHQSPQACAGPAGGA